METVTPSVTASVNIGSGAWPSSSVCNAWCNSGSLYINIIDYDYQNVEIPEWTIVLGRVNSPYQCGKLYIGEQQYMSKSIFDSETKRRLIQWWSEAQTGYHLMELRKLYSQEEMQRVETWITNFCFN